MQIEAVFTLYRIAFRALHFRGRRGAASLRYKTRAEITVLMREQKVFVGAKAIRCSLNKTANRSYALPRFQTLARRSVRFVQFSSVHFYLAKIQYNTRIHVGIVRLQGSPEETRRLYEA